MFRVVGFDAAGLDGCLQEVLCPEYFCESNSPGPGRHDVDDDGQLSSAEEQREELRRSHPKSQQSIAGGSLRKREWGGAVMISTVPLCLCALLKSFLRRSS